MSEVCPLAPTIGEILDGKWRIEREVRRVATGVVYEASETHSGRRVAIRTLFEATSGDSELAARCQREARAAGGIGNRHILHVFDSGRSPRGLVFLVTEILDGAPLSSWLKQSLRLPVSLAVDVMSQVLSGLSVAHQHGIVHRGLSPDGIFVLNNKERPNSIKLIDFGVAKGPGGPAARSGAARPTGNSAGVAPGTLLYLSPEQIRGEAVDQRTDLYSAGVILYQMLCGGAPFQGDDVARLQREILEGDYPKPRAVRPELPATLENTIVRALERDLRKRFATASAMRDLLGSRGAASAPAPAATPALPDSFVLEPDTVVDAQAVVVPSGPRPSPPSAAPSSPRPSPGPTAPDLGPTLTLDREASAKPAEPSLAPPRPAAEPPPLRLDMSARARAQARDRGATMAAFKLGRRGFPKWVWLVVGVLVVVLILVLRPRRPAVLSAAPPPPSRDEIQSFHLRISPEKANVTIDHVPVSARELPIDSGPPRAHLLKVAAPGHLTRTFTFTASPGTELVVRLGHTLPAPAPTDPPPLPSELAVDYPEQPRPAEEIVAAFAELERHAACLTSALWSLPPRARQLFEEEGFAPCRSLLAEPAPPTPQFLALRPAAEVYLAAAKAGGKPESLHRMAARYRAEFLAERTYWQMQELARIGQDEGRKAPWHLRRVALTAAAWVRALKSGAANARGVDAQAAKLEANVQALQAYVRGGNSGIGSIRGADDFLRAAEEMLALARLKAGARAGEGAIYETCRKLLTDFDALVLD